jgi:site-specific DNA-adenine methylase
VLPSRKSYFGGKSGACETVWAALGDPDNYVEPFAGSAAMLLGSPEGKRVETINDYDGLVANFWRAIAADAEAVAEHADWPVNECVPAGTLISTPDGDVPIEHIKPGMIVLGESNGKVVETIVLATKQSEASEFYGVGPLRLTGNHPVWTKEHGYLDAANLVGGMTVQVIDWPNNKPDLVMLKCNDGKQSLGNLFIDRPTDDSDSLYRGDVSQKEAFQRTHFKGHEWRKNTQGLLDTDADCCGFPADISSDGNGDGCRLAGCRNTADCCAPGHVESLQPHGRRGRDTRAFSVGEMQESCFTGPQRNPVPAWANRCDEGEKSHAGSGGEDTLGGDRARYAGQHKAENIGSTQREAAFNRAQAETCGGEDWEAAIRGAQEKAICGCDSSTDSLRGDGSDIPVNNCCGECAGGERSLCVSSCAQGMPLQRESLRAPVAVYNFQTETGNYFAEKVLVHNCDLFARHSWLVRNRESLIARLHDDPEWYCAKSAGWWVWGACNWIGSGWCSGTGPWVHDGTTIVDSRKLPHLSAGQGINRQLPHLGDAGQGINRKLPHLGNAGRGARSAYIHEWFCLLQSRLRDVRVTCGDWQRVLKDSVTTRHGLTGIFLDPPYDKGSMDYGAGGMGLGISAQVREWCQANGTDPLQRIVLCGHAGEHDELLAHGWHIRTWKARKGYALTDEAVENSASETLWCSPHCVPEIIAQGDLFDSYEQTHQERARSASILDKL